MIRIELTVYEKHDLLKILEKYKEIKTFEYYEKKITNGEYNYDIRNINRIISAINGHTHSDYDMISGLANEKSTDTKKERGKINIYTKNDLKPKKEKDLLDLFDEDE